MTLFDAVPVWSILWWEAFHVSSLWVNVEAQDGSESRATIGPVARRRGRRALPAGGSPSGGGFLGMFGPLFGEWKNYCHVQSVARVVTGRFFLGAPQLLGMSY